MLLRVRRYGFIGQNGSGKSTLMRVIGARAVPLPDGRSHTPSLASHVDQLLAGDRCGVLIGLCFLWWVSSGIDVFHLTHEIEASEMTALEAVVSVDEERAKLEKEADLLNHYITEEVGDEEDDYGSVGSHGGGRREGLTWTGWLAVGRGVVQGAEDREDYNDVMDRIQQVRQSSTLTHPQPHSPASHLSS